MNDTKFGCGCASAVLAFNLLLGGWSVDLISNYFGKDVPFWLDSVVGLFVAELSVPVALLLKVFG